MRVIIAIAIFSLAMPLGANLSERSVPSIDLSPVSIYDLAEYATGAPAEILRGIAFAESSNGKKLDHPDPLDRGWFGLHESPAIHAERAAKWFEFDADNPVQAAMIAGHLLMDNLAQLGDMRLAIAAYKQGVQGVRDDGVAEWYVERVMGASK